MGNLVVDLIEQFDRQLVAELAGDGGQVQRGVRGAADGTVHNDRVAESSGSQDLIRRNILFGKLHDLAAGIAGILKQIAHGGGNKSRTGQRQTQRLGNALHSGGGTEEAAGADGGAAGQLEVADLLRGDGAVALLTQRNIPGYDGCGHMRAGTHGSAGHEDCGNIQTCHGLQMRRDGFVAAGGENHAVPGNGAAMDLHHVGNGLAGSEHIVHAVIALRAAVADIRGVVLGRLAAHFINTVNGLLDHLVEVIAAGMRVAVNALNHDLWLDNIRVIPAGAHVQSVKLCPEFSVRCAFLIHKNTPLYTLV